MPLLSAALTTMNDIKAVIASAIIARCKANGLAGWGQGDSLAILREALKASSATAEEAELILSSFEAHKLFNPSQAMARFTEIRLLPERPAKKRSSGSAALDELKKLAQGG